MKEDGIEDLLGLAPLLEAMSFATSSELARSPEYLSLLRAVLCYNGLAALEPGTHKPLDLPGALIIGMAVGMNQGLREQIRGILDRGANP